MSNYFKYLRRRLRNRAHERYGKFNYVETLSALTGEHCADVQSVFMGSGEGVKLFVLEKVCKDLGFELKHQLADKQKESLCD